MEYEWDGDHRTGRPEDDLGKERKGNHVGSQFEAALHYHERDLGVDGAQPNCRSRELSEM